MITLGDFELGEQLGRGGMAEVWAATHRRAGVAVAVKVVTTPDVRRPAQQAALRNELRAMTRLDHPHIVMVLDFGQVSSAEAEASAGALGAGSPYLVMEQAAGGTALPWCGRLSWHRVKRVLVSLLRALSHAHARGVVHRDVKPSNLLLFDGQVKLSDFGLAVDLAPTSHEPGPRGRVLGTPAYMAPEQFVGDWREYGPATDLYAVGCVAYALVCGAPPYGRGHDITLMYELHAQAVIPPLEPRMPVPAGFELWVAQLLEKKPSRRYQWAADALRALSALGDPPHDTTPLQDDLAPIAAASSSVVTVAAEPAARLVNGQAELHDSLPPPTPALHFPTTWRRPRARPQRSMDLLGAGLGVFGLRPVPLVGRESERDALWDELRAVFDGGTKRCLLLGGPAGCGKSRLAAWLCQRASETGVATVLRAVHTRRRGPAEGLAAMWASHFRCVGIEGAALRAFLARRLARLGVDDPAEAAALAEIIDPRPANEADATVRFGSAAERYTLMARVLRQLARTRPVVLWLEDVNWDLDSLAFAEHLLQTEDDGAGVLLLATAADEDLAEQPEARRASEALVAQPAGRSLRVLPLDERQWPELVGRLLRLDEPLAARIAERTRGNPLFAVQLVGHLVDREQLEAGPEGFRLAAGAQPELPEGIGFIWRQRIERLLAGRAPEAGMALELAAVLGEVVDADEWRRCCQAAAVTPSLALIEALIERRLATAAERGPQFGFTLVHGMLREALELRAAEHGRLKDHHQRCAQMLAERAGDRVAERLGRHWLAAGQPERAIEPLLCGATQRTQRGEYGLADALLTERDEALSALECSEDDPRRASGWILRARIAAKQGRFGAGLEWASLVVQAAREMGLGELECEATLLRARLGRMRGEASGAERDVRQAVRQARALPQQPLLIASLLELGRVLMHKGEVEAAGEQLAEAYELSLQGEDRQALADACWARAHQLSYLGDYQRAQQYNSRGIEELRRSGDRWGLARGLNTAGEIARLRDRLADAEQHYREARDIMVAIGAVDAAAVCESNLARVLVQRGRYADARRQLERSRPRFEEQQRRNPLAWLWCVLLVCDAGERAWAQWDEHLRCGEALLADTGYLDLDIATVAQMAAGLARQRGERRRARAAFGLAERQWRGLGRIAEADEARAAMTSLGCDEPTGG